MKRNSIADSITALSLAGHATEMAVWRFVRDVATQLAALHREGRAHGAVTLDAVTVQGPSFVLSTAEGSECFGAASESFSSEEGATSPQSESFSSKEGAACPQSESFSRTVDRSTADDVWQLGACIHTLITGNAPFGGQGRTGQEAHTPMPVFSASRASAAVSALTARCLVYDPAARIAAADIVTLADEELSRYARYCADREHLKYKKPQNRRIRMKTYDFWPEVMVSLLLLLMMVLPQSASAQSNAELEKLIRLTTTMRDQSKRGQVLRELRDDDKWTLMDELRVSINECSYSDKVSMFGVNDIAAEIAQRERGIVNVGGRFKHSADGKHHYSFIELTALAGKAISYVVRGHQGTQQIAVVPFDPKCRYVATCYSDGKEVSPHTVKDGVSYYNVKVDKNGKYEFSIANLDKKNSSFVVITYNPMQ